MTDYNTAAALWYNPASGMYTVTSSSTVLSYFYYDPFNGHYDAIALYGPTGYYALAQNLDASGTAYTNALLGSFKGTLAGLGHTISNLTINAPSVTTWAW